MRRHTLRLIPLGLLCLGTFAQAQDGYQRLLQLHARFLEFRRPHPVGGVLDSSPPAIRRRREALRGFQQSLAAISTRDWPVSQKVDDLLVRSQMNDLDFELRVVRPFSRDPGYYLDQIRRLPYVDLPLQGDALEPWRTRLRAVPAILSQARANLTEPARDLARLAIRHLEQYDGVGQGEPRREVPPEGIRGWYRDLVQRLQTRQPALLPEGRAALAAVERYLGWLRERLPRMRAPAGVGLDNYAWYLKNVRYLPYSIHDLRLLSRRELGRIQTFLQIERNHHRGLPELRIPASGREFDRSVREAERQIRAWIRKYDLLTIPENTPPRFETDAFWIVRPGGHRHFWEEIQYRNPLNNHIHASIPGHRFDALIAERNPNPIRRSHRDGPRIEGWAYYLEEMFLQSGLLEGQPRVRELFYIAALKRAVRVPAELGLQSGKFNLEQAMAFMMRRVPFLDENLARYDLEIYLRRPTYGMNYTVGKIQIEQLLGERRLQLGQKFSLGRFHDALLEAGMIPISLIRWEMTGRGDQVRQFLAGNE